MQPRVDPSIPDIAHGWIPAFARRMRLKYARPVYWGLAARQRRTGLLYLDESGAAVVFFLAGHIWLEAHGVFLPDLSGYTTEANLECRTLRAACVTNHEFEESGFTVDV